MIEQAQPAGINRCFDKLCHRCFDQKPLRKRVCQTLIFSKLS